MAPNKRTGTDLVQTPSKAEQVNNEPDSDTKDPSPGSNGPNLALIAKFDQITAEKGCTQWLMDWIEEQGRVLVVLRCHVPAGEGCGLPHRA